MKVAALCVLAVALAVGVAGDLPPPQRSYKILMVLPISVKSHKIVIKSVAEALAQRGHQVVILTGKKSGSTHPNITEVSHDLPYFSDAGYDTFILRQDFMKLVKTFTEDIKSVSRELYKVPAVKDLYERRKEFDVIILDYRGYEVSMPFVHEMPYMVVHTGGLELVHSAVLGNVLHPSYLTGVFDSLSLTATWQRLRNTVAFFLYRSYFNAWFFLPIIKEELYAQFPELPPLEELERNQSVALLNSHFSISKVAPLLPSQVEVGAMHCRPAKPLPQELESWVAAAGDAGVIYFSLGSVTRGSSMPEQYLDFLLEAFRRLPQRVLWKYEGEMKGASDNVKISRWLPQQDILAHHSVKVFITHGGLLSVQEAMYHATPLIVIPIYGDQTKNGKFVEDSGLGHVLVWEELTADQVVDAVTSVVNDTKYARGVARMSAHMRDQLTTPQQRAVFWTEYVIRHRGAPHLKSPATELSWVEFLLLDVLALVIAALLVLLPLIRCVVAAILAKCRSAGGKRKVE